ncbi:hypothetical protein J6590_005712 [Homalodisca vitripennis]|nr:hypothetical protein J6590_005712 [Homalodisca vitripennis]
MPESSHLSPSQTAPTSISTSAPRVNTSCTSGVFKHGDVSAGVSSDAGRRGAQSVELPATVDRSNNGGTGCSSSTYGRKYASVLEDHTRLPLTEAPLPSAKRRAKCQVPVPRRTMPIVPVLTSPVYFSCLDNSPSPPPCPKQTPVPTHAL